jgi:hypothetical protein
MIIGIGQIVWDKLYGVADVRIRLAEVFDEKTEEAVAKEIKTDKKTLEGLSVAEEPD